MSVQEIASTVIASSRSSPSTGVVGYIALGKTMRIAIPIADPIAATSKASATMQACGFFASASSWARPRRKPERGDLRGELDRQHRISEAAERGRPVNSPADEQERHHPRRAAARSRRC